jgi:hypothetical protein
MRTLRIMKSAPFTAEESTSMVPLVQVAGRITKVGMSADAPNDRGAAYPDPRSALLDDGVDDALGDVDHGLADPRGAAVQLAARDSLRAVLDAEQPHHSGVIGGLELVLGGDGGVRGRGRVVAVGPEL